MHETRYEIDRLNEDLKEAVERGLVPNSVYIPVRLHLQKESKKRAPYTEALETQREIEDVQCYVSDIVEMRDDDKAQLEQQLTSLWCRLDELKGMVKV